MSKRSKIRAAVLGALAVFSSAAFAQAPTSTFTYTVPGTVNAGGLNGTKFVSDLAITNPGTAPVLATLALVPANGLVPATVLLSPGQTVVDRNLLQLLWGASGAGATVVTAGSPLLIRARTYNTAASGTYGVALPVFPDDRFLSPGDTGDSLWISQSADGSTGYRTNVAVVFPDSGGGDGTVTIYDAAGNVAGSQAFSLSDPGFQQFAVGSFAGGVPIARAQLAVTRGRAAGYAVVVDNVTGDSSLFPFEDLPAGRQDVVVNGVARAGGRNGTFFRTDARIYNPTGGDATVMVAFHANQNANPSPATSTFNVPAGQILDVVDVLQSLLGLPIGSAGALRFTSDAPVAILCRTSNVDPAGVVPGTYGAQQRPTPVLSFLTSADAGAVVTGIRQGGSFRTNVGFAAGADGASFTLTLQNAAGAVAGTTSGSLGAWGWTQPNVQDLFPTATIPDDATLKVTVTAGSVDVFDSSIDNASGDPVVTPIMPLPVAIPSSATIGPAGGSIQSSDGRFTLLVPAGALSTPTPMSIGTTASDAPQGVGPAYVLSPANPAFAKPALARLSYGPDDVSGSSGAALAIAFHQPDGWYSLGDGLLDPGRRTLTVALSGGGPGASARRALGLFDGHFAILCAWEIVPKSAVIWSGGTVHFSAYYAGPPSTTSCINPFCYAKLTSPYGVDVQWSLGSTAQAGSVAPESGTSTTYTSQCGLVGSATVRFAIGIAGVPGLTKAYPNGLAHVSIYSRNWQVTLEQKTTGLCPGQSGQIWSWSSNVVEGFEVTDAGGPVSGMIRVSGSGYLDANQSCLKNPSCSFALDPNWPRVSVDSVDGALDPARGIVLDAHYTEQAALVGYQATCNGQTAEPVPSRPGKSFHTDSLVMGPKGDSTKIPPKDDLNYVKWTFQPVDPTCN